MSSYWYDQDSGHLYTDRDMSHPFLCSAEATPLKFKTVSECFEFLNENSFKGSVMYKLQSPLS